MCPIAKRACDDVGWERNIALSVMRFNQSLASGSEIDVKNRRGIPKHRYQCFMRWIYHELQFEMNNETKPRLTSPPVTPSKKRKTSPNAGAESSSPKKAKNEQVDKAEFLDAIFDHARKTGTDYLMKRVSTPENRYISGALTIVRSRRSLAWTARL